MRLYHYVHCPFCVRVRMVLGFFEQNYDSKILSYDDEDTPLKLAGKKMLPIMEFESETLNESLDIIRKIDSQDKLKTKTTLSKISEIDTILNEFGKNVHSLAMPYFIWTPEFDESSRMYFQKKKEVKRGPFSKLVHNRFEFQVELNKSLNKYKHLFEKDLTKDTLTLEDILYASHLWGMYIVPEFQFELVVHNFLQKVRELCHFEYHGDYWRE